MAEETRNARTASAYGLILTCVSTAVIGMLFTLGLLYAIPPSLGVGTVLGTSDAALSLPANSVVPANAAFAVFVIACGNRMGAALANLAIVNFFFAGMSSLSVTTRIGFAMARDGAIPGSTFFRRVSSWTKSPVPMVALVALFDCFLLLLPLTTISLQDTYGAIAFNAVTSIATIGYQASYAVPLFLRVTYRRKDFPKSDYNNGWLSLPIAWAAFIWLFCTSLFFFWPTAWPVNKFTMNCAPRAVRLHSVRRGHARPAPPRRLTPDAASARRRCLRAQTRWWLCSALARSRWCGGLRWRGTRTRGPRDRTCRPSSS